MENIDVKTYNAMIEALQRAERFMDVARNYFPKSIRNRDTFDLLNTGATISKALWLAKGEADAN